MRYKKRVEIIEAELFDGTNNPFGIIKQHQCDYRMCPVCGGSNTITFYFDEEKGKGIFYIEKGDYVIKNEYGQFSILTKYFLDKYFEPYA